MTYPQNDDDFADGYVTFVRDKGGDMLEVGHCINWMGGTYNGMSLQPRNDCIKVGAHIRIYAFQGLPERGVYIGGRVVRPYKTKQQAAAWRKQQAALRSSRWKRTRSKTAT